MTTNSPNSVDGDVQALIEHCQLRIKVLQNYWHANAEEMRLAKLDLRAYETTLASLTAEPVAHRYAYLPVIGDADWKYVDSSEYANKSSGYSGQDLYTTPPAKLLRPVELPDCVDDLHGVGPVMSADAVVEALRQQGYEVKND